MALSMARVQHPIFEEREVSVYGQNKTARPAICKRCGEQMVAWYQNKAGKWYLCQIVRQSASHSDTRYYAAVPMMPHKCGEAQ